MSGPVEIILIIAAICYVMARRMIGEPAEAKRMLILPGVLFVIGLDDVTKQVHNPSALLFLAISAGLSVLLGVLRGLSVRITDRGGLAFVQYRVFTLILWVLNIGLKFGLNAVVAAVNPAAATALSSSLLVTLGAGMIVEGLVTLARALRGDSQVMWAKGKDGQPHTMSPTLNNIQQSLRPGSRPDNPGYPHNGQDAGPGQGFGQNYGQGFGQGFDQGFGPGYQPGQRYQRPNPEFRPFDDER